MTIRFSRELPLFNFERPDILCPKFANLVHRRSARPIPANFDLCLCCVFSFSFFLHSYLLQIPHFSLPLFFSAAPSPCIARLDPRAAQFRNSRSNPELHNPRDSLPIRDTVSNYRHFLSLENHNHMSFLAEFGIPGESFRILRFVIEGSIMIWKM